MAIVKYELSKDDLIYNLKEQLYFLDSSLSLFASHSFNVKLKNKVIEPSIEVHISSEVEAKRIGATLRILLHDTSHSISLLKLVGLKDKMSFIDSCMPNDGKLHSMSGVQGVRGKSSGDFLGLIAKVNTGKSFISVPLFKQHLEAWYSSYSQVNFTDWWEKEIAEIDGSKYTRKSLVLLIANKDGGAHVDSYHPMNYNTAKNSKLSLDINGMETEFERGIVFASIAQIGWEFLNSIKNEDFINA